MNKTFFLSILALLVSFVALPLGAMAGVGVSVNTGKIILDKPLIPGGIYALPSFQVTNTGTDPADFSVSVEYNEVQQQLKPNPEWFRLEPTDFHLGPGEIKLVKVSVEVPSSAPSGDYFAYIEAHSLKNAYAVAPSSIAGAAASKLYFTVAPSNGLETAYYSILSFISDHSPWTYIVLWILVLSIAYLFLKRIHFFAKMNKVITENN